MENKTMNTSFLERFPEWSEIISQLNQRDADFAEICEDYQELSEWLVAHEHEGCTSESECAANRLLLEELEIDLLKILDSTERESDHQA